MSKARFGHQRRVRFVRQRRASDTTVATLAMVLDALGARVGLDELDDTVGGMGTLEEMAAACGLSGEGVRIGVNDLSLLSPGAILHWDYPQFVVFEGVGQSGVELVDPTCGRRRVPFDAFWRSFSGIAVVFERTPHRATFAQIAQR